MAITKEDLLAVQEALVRNRILEAKIRVTTDAVSTEIVTHQVAIEKLEADRDAKLRDLELLIAAEQKIIDEIAAKDSETVISQKKFPKVY